MCACALAYAHIFSLPHCELLFIPVGSAEKEVSDDASCRSHSTQGQRGTRAIRLRPLSFFQAYTPASLSLPLLPSPLLSLSSSPYALVVD